MQDKLKDQKFDVIYDMNGREAADTAPLADMFNGKVEHFIYMSSAGVYKKSLMMPHQEVSCIGPLNDDNDYSLMIFAPLYI